MYLPTLGRFASRDPVNEEGVDLLHDNNRFGQRLDAMQGQAYAYVGSNPVNRVDPSGAQELFPALPGGMPPGAGTPVFKPIPDDRCGTMVAARELRIPFRPCKKGVEEELTCYISGEQGNVTFCVTCLTTRCKQDKECHALCVDAENAAGEEMPSCGCK